MAPLAPRSTAWSAAHLEESAEEVLAALTAALHDLVRFEGAVRSCVVAAGAILRDAGR